MKTIPREDWRVTLRTTSAGVPEMFVAKVRCPGCRQEGELDHTVDPDGTVRPSLDCPLCDYHEFVRLAEWAEVAETDLPITYPQKVPGVTGG